MGKWLIHVKPNISSTLLLNVIGKVFHLLDSSWMTKMPGVPFKALDK